MSGWEYHGPLSGFGYEAFPTGDTWGLWRISVDSLGLAHKIGDDTDPQRYMDIGWVAPKDDGFASHGWLGTEGFYVYPITWLDFQFNQLNFHDVAIGAEGFAGMAYGLRPGVVINMAFFTP
jgi:hypothetical protein